MDLTAVGPARSPRSPAADRISLLYVATVAQTLRFLVPYAAYFRSEGWYVTAAAHGASGDGRLVEAFDRVHDLPLSRSPRDLSGLVRGERRIRSLLLERPDIVHVHTPIAGFITRLAVRRTPSSRRPNVAYTAHGFHFHEGGGALSNLFFLAVEKVAGRWTDRLVVINDEDHEAARRHRIVRPGGLVRLPGVGIDTDVYARSRISAGDRDQALRQAGVQSGLPVFVMVGELNRNKRAGDAIEALAAMRHNEVGLLLIGRGSERPRLEALVDRRGLRDRVRFAGFVEDVRPLVAGAVGFVQTSEREGLARSIMEALALEVPVIASMARGNEELVTDDSGLLVPTGDVGRLAAGMDWLLDHDAEREEMGRRGRIRMIRQYDVKILIRLHGELYRAMLQAPVEGRS